MIAAEAITKTSADCAACPVLGRCNAHITGGSWDHAAGAHPCRPVIAPARSRIINADDPNAPATVREQCLAKLAEIRKGPHTVRTVH